MRRIGLVLVAGLGVAFAACDSDEEGGPSGAASGGSAGQFSADTTLLRAAVVLGSCYGDDGVNRVLTNLYDPTVRTPMFYTRLGAQAECLATFGGGCRAVEECLGVHVEAYSGACEPCIGAVYAGCENGYRFTVDCSAVGMQCDPIAGCTDEVPAEPCDEGSFVPSCTAEGESRICNGGAVRTSSPCSQLGLECVDGLCAGTGEACVSDHSSREDGIVSFEGLACDGQYLDACVEGRAQRRDCASVHPQFTCQSVDGMYFCGLDSQCVPGNVDVGTHGTEERREGTDLVFCNAGRIARIDCTDLGFVGCDVENGLGCTPGIQIH